MYRVFGNYMYSLMCSHPCKHDITGVVLSNSGQRLNFSFQLISEEWKDPSYRPLTEKLLHWPDFFLQRKFVIPLASVIRHIPFDASDDRYNLPVVCRGIVGISEPVTPGSASSISPTGQLSPTPCEPSSAPSAILAHHASARGALILHVVASIPKRIG